MSRKIAYYILAIIVSVTFVAPSKAQQMLSGRTSLPIRVSAAEDPVVLGQDEPAKKPGLFERMKRSIANWAKDDDFDDQAPRRNQEENARPQSTVSVPTRPPKPVTATEVRKAIDQPDQPVAEKRPNQELRVATNPGNQGRPSDLSMETRRNPPLSVSDENADQPAQEETIFERLKQIREQVFDKQNLDETTLYQTAIDDGPKKAPMPAPLEDSRTVRQTPSKQRTPPPSMIEKPMPERHTASAVVEPAEGEYVSEGRSGEPIPLRSRTNQNALQETAEPLRESAGLQKDLSSRRAGRTVLESESHNTTLPNRTPQLSSVSVERGASRPHATSRLRETSADTVERKTASLTDRAGTSRNEYEISSRRMLLNEQSDAEPLETPTVTVDSASVETTSPVSSKTPEKTLMVSPRLEVETESDSRAIVGQEASYKIRVSNRGGAAAEQVVLSVEIPNWIEIRQPDVSAGTTSIVPRTETKDVRDFTWKISRIEAGADVLLVLRLVPQQRKSIDLKIRYDFFRPTAVTKLVVQEPVIEMELDGPGEVLWGTKVGYRLLVRNTGNGDAENVKLELLQTGSDMKSCELSLLRPGEEQVIDVDVWTGKQEHIDINIQATGLYDLEAKVSKRVKVMRPNVVMTVDGPTVQFVGSPAEFSIKVRNVGNAEAKDIDLVATLPLGARFDSCSEGGEATPQNQVQWKIESIPVGDVFTARIVCEPKREGACQLEAAVNDKSGVLASCSSVFDATAIVELKLDVETPQGPIEVGQEAIYTLNLVNRGTKAAENVEVSVFFGKNLEPYAIEGGTAYTNDGQVVFDKIPTIGAEQRLTLKVKARADEPGSHRVRTEAVCGTAEIHLVNEQATYFYKKQKGKSVASSKTVETGVSESDSLRIARPAPAVSVTDTTTELAVVEEKPSLPIPPIVTPTPAMPTIVPPPLEPPKIVDPFLQ